MVGFALQFVTGPGNTVPLVCLYTSFVLLTIFAVKNIKIVGFPIVLFGIALNFAVIGLNGRGANHIQGYLDQKNVEIAYSNWYACGVLPLCRSWLRNWPR